MNITDQIGKNLSFSSTPKKVVCLVPSITEFLFHIGLKKEIIGITKFCIHPKELVKNIAKIGGTKKINFNAIETLNPDLIIANKEENTEQEILELQKKYTVYVSDIVSIEDCFDMMYQLGKICDKEIEVNKVINQLKADFNHIKNYFKNTTAAYFIWKKPYMLAANETFINTLLTHLGFNNSLINYKRYPELCDEQLKQLSPDFCFLSSEPYSFKQKDIEALKQILPNSKIILVDGEMFSWYGSRLIHLKNYVKELKELISE